MNGEVEIMIEATRVSNDAYEKALALHGLKSITTNLAISYNPDGGDDFHFYDKTGKCITDWSKTNDLTCINFTNDYDDNRNIEHRIVMSRYCRVIIKPVLFSNSICILYGLPIEETYEFHNLESVKNWDSTKNIQQVMLM